MISDKQAVRPEGVKVLGLTTSRNPQGVEKNPRVVPEFPYLRLSRSGIDGDCHRGATREVKRHESKLLSGQQAYNERAVSVCIAQELLKVAREWGLTKDWIYIPGET